MSKKSKTAGLEQFKMEAAREVGVTLGQGYNGELTAKQACSVGGQAGSQLPAALGQGCCRGSKLAPELSCGSSRFRQCLRVGCQVLCVLCGQA